MCQKCVKFRVVKSVQNVSKSVGGGGIPGCRLFSNWEHTEVSNVVGVAVWSRSGEWNKWQCNMCQKCVKKRVQNVCKIVCEICVWNVCVKFVICVFVVRSEKGGKKCHFGMLPIGGIYSKIGGVKTLRYAPNLMLIFGMLPIGNEIDTPKNTSVWI